MQEQRRAARFQHDVRVRARFLGDQVRDFRVRRVLRGGRVLGGRVRTAAVPVSGDVRRHFRRPVRETAGVRETVSERRAVRAGLRHQGAAVRVSGRLRGRRVSTPVVRTG